MSNSDTNINIRVTSSADTAGIDAANKALDEMTGKQQGAADSARIDEIVSPAAVETVTATTEAFGEMEDQTRDLDARLQQAARSYMATGTSAERAMGTIVLSYDRTASAAKTAQAAVYSLQQALSEVSSTGTIGLGVSPETAKTVDETTAAYEELLQRVAELEQQLQQQAMAHKTTRAAAEQSAGGIVGAYKRAKGAVMTVKGAINSVMWWMAAANQAVELVGKAWDFINAKSRAAKAAADQQADAEQKAWERTKALEQAVYDELSARKKAAREMEQARVNRTYEDRIKYIERAMELEAILAQIKAAKTDDQYAIAQAQLQRDLATQKITQAQYDEQSRQLEVDHNEELRKQAEDNAAAAVNTAKEQERINREAYEAQMQRLRKLKEAAGTVYHDFDVMGQRFSVGIDPAKSKIMTPAKYNEAIENGKQSDTSRGDDEKKLDDLKAQREKLKKSVANWTDLFGEYLVKKTNDYKKLQAIELEIPETEKRLKQVKADYQKYDELIKRHQDALLAFGTVDKKDGDPNKWTKGAAVFTEEMSTLSNTAEVAGSVSAALKTLKTSTDAVTDKQNKQTGIIEVNNSAREREAQVTDAQRVGRGAEQSRAAEQQASAARIGAAQVMVDQLQRTAEQQQQAAKAQQEAIDKMISGTSDKDFKSLLDRYGAAIAQRPAGQQRDRMQEAFGMYQGYVTASPEQLAGKADELAKVLDKIMLSFSEIGPQDLAAFDQLTSMLRGKMSMGDQMRGTATQQQAAGNNLTEVRDAETSIAAVDEHEQTQRAAVSAVATAARALRERITDPQQQADLDTIIEVMHDGQVAADETSVLVNAFGSLADSNREAADSLVSGLSTAVKSGEGFLAFARESLGKTAEGAAAMQRQEAEITALRGSIAHIKWSNGTLP